MLYGVINSETNYRSGLNRTGWITFTLIVSGLPTLPSCRIAGLPDCWIVGRISWVLVSYRSFVSFLCKCVAAP